MAPRRSTAPFLLAVALLAGLFGISGAAITPLNGSGSSCVPRADGLGSNCPAGEYCCATTNFCVSAASCGDVATVCPPPTCEPVDTKFSDSECPLEATQKFKKAAGLRCSASSDLYCFTNGTALVLECKPNAAGDAARTTVSAAAAGVLMCAPRALVLS